MKSCRLMAFLQDRDHCVGAPEHSERVELVRPNVHIGLKAEAHTSYSGPPYSRNSIRGALQHVG